MVEFSPISFDIFLYLAEALVKYMIIQLLILHILGNFCNHSGLYNSSSQTAASTSSSSQEFVGGFTDKATSSSLQAVYDKQPILCRSTTPWTDYILLAYIDSLLRCQQRWRNPGDANVVGKSSVGNIHIVPIVVVIGTKCRTRALCRPSGSPPNGRRVEDAPRM